MEANDIALHPAKRLTTLAGGSFFENGSSDDRSTQQAARRAVVLRAPANSTTLWPGDYIELELPQGLASDSLHALEPCSDIPQVHLVATSELWPPPGIISSVAKRIRIPNLSGEPIKLKRHEHFCQFSPVFNTLPTSLSNQSTFRLRHLVAASHQLSALTQTILNRPICSRHFAHSKVTLTLFLIPRSKGPF